MTEPDVPPQGIDPDDAYSIVNTISDGMAALISAIRGWISQYFANNFTNWVNVPLSSVMEFLANWITVFSQRGNSIYTELVNTLSAKLDDLAAGSTGFFQGLLKTLIDGISTLGSYVASIVGNVFNALWDNVAGAIDSVGQFLEPILTPLYAAAESVVSFGADVLMSLGDFFSDVTGGISAGIDAVYVNLVEPVVLQISEMVEYVQAIFIQFAAYVPQIPDKLLDLRERALVFFRDEFLPLAEQYGSDQWAMFAELFSQYLNSASTAVRDDLADAARISGVGSVAAVVNDLMAGGGLSQNRVIRAALLAFAMVPIITGTIGAVAAPEIELAIQANNELRPVKLLQLAEVAEAAQRGIIPQDQFYAHAKMLGFSFAQADHALALRKQLVPPGEMVSWWRRDLITRGDLSTALVRQGFKVEDAANIITASDIIPPVEDMIRFAVREVYSPDIAAAFGLSEGFPAEFANQARKQGLTPEVALQYWMAHWALPSVNMFFEMYQREIIDLEQLNTGLRALDIMPFFRDKLTSLSYNVLTRVDIRRIHALGLIDHDELVRRLRHGGYSPEDAAMMAEFYEVYNEDVSTLGKEKEKDLTRAQIVDAFKDGLLSHDNVLELLIALGYSEDDAGVIIIGAELDIEMRLRKEERTAVVELAANGDLDLDAAQERLGSAGFTPEEIAIAVNEIVRKQRTRTRTPDLAQLDKMLAKGVLKEGEYIQGLRALGFSAFWIEKLAALQGITEV